MSDYYQILGVKRQANFSEIKRAYREAIKKCHPDLNHSVDATGATQKITAAYAVLSDAVKRAEYDQRLAFRGTGTAPRSRPTSPPPQPSWSRPPPPPADRQAACQCQGCGAIDPTLRMIIFTWVISLLVISSKRGWMGVLCRKCQIKYAFFFNCALVFFGVWGIPWGIIWSVQGLRHNLRGGIQPTENNALLLSTLGHRFFSEGQYQEAATSFRESLNFMSNPEVRHNLAECERRFAGRKNRLSERILGRELPIWIYHGAAFLGLILGLYWGRMVFLLLIAGALLFGVARRIDLSWKGKKPE